MKHLVRFVLVVGLVWGLVAVGLGLLVYTTGESDTSQPSDVIIVLGSGLRRNGSPGDALTRRSVWAAQLYQQGIAENIICTGGIGRNQRRSEASACREILLARGVPDSAILLEEQSKSTEENALYSAEIMAANDWSSAVLVTDSFHMLRADWIFDQVGVEHSRSPVPREWVRRLWYARLFTREIIALHWQAFQDVFNLNVTRVDL
ncbi:MAG: YdcF family protein [bacterium]|nr:YdcF family protein [bacterium]